MPGTPQPNTNFDWAELTLTHRCNQRCFFCYEDGRDVAAEPSLAEVTRLMEQTATHAESVVLCGREVLLRRDVLDIVASGSSLGLRVSVFTNGQALARPGLVPQLVEAGCSSVVVSFHFPDPPTFAHAARVRPRGFDRAIAGLQTVGQYNREHPHRQLPISTESDMFALNLGRLDDMRQTLIDALGDSPWKMRLGCLLPTRVHDIGLEHVLEPLLERRAELETFLRTQPTHIPLNFVKVPLCILPEGEEHRCLEVGYVYDGTLLTHNHAKIDRIDVDADTTSSDRDIPKALSAHPYRWLCRTCNLAPLCRFERVSWELRGFEPHREQRPEPRLTVRASEVVARLGAARTGADRVDKVQQQLAHATPFPEEDLLTSLHARLPEGYEIADTWAERQPLVVIALRHVNTVVPLHLRVPDAQVTEDEELGHIVDTFDVRVLKQGQDTVPSSIEIQCIRALARAEFPPLDRWSGDHWFDLQIAQLFRRSWLDFGERLWPGHGTFDRWETRAAKRSGSALVTLRLAHPSGAIAELGHHVRRSESIPVRTMTVLSLRPGVTTDALPWADYRALLQSVGNLLGVEQQVPEDLTTYEHIRRGHVDACVRDGKWHLRKSSLRAGDRPGIRLEFTVVDRSMNHREHRFQIARLQHKMPYFRSAGGLALTYERGALTPSATLFARILLTAMGRLGATSLTADGTGRWREVVEELLRQSNQAGRFTWSVSPAGAADALGGRPRFP